MGVFSLLLLDPPPGPDICHFLGFCSSVAGPPAGANMLYLATAMLVAGVVIQRQGRKR